LPYVERRDELRQRAAFILRQIDRRAPREPGENDELRRQ
jgi:hypothetical protein